MPRFLIRDASAYSTSHEVDTSYTMAEMVRALTHSDSDCGFVGEFVDTICGRSDVHCSDSSFVSYQYDVLSIEVEYYDAYDIGRTMEIRVIEAN